MAWIIDFTGVEAFKASVLRASSLLPRETHCDELAQLLNIWERGQGMRAVLTDDGRVVLEPTECILAAVATLSAAHGEFNVADCHGWPVLSFMSEAPASPQQAA